MIVLWCWRSSSIGVALKTKSKNLKKAASLFVDEKKPARKFNPNMGGRKLVKITTYKTMTEQLFHLKNNKDNNFIYKFKPEAFCVLVEAFQTNRSMSHFVKKM